MSMVTPSEAGSDAGCLDECIQWWLCLCTGCELFIPTLRGRGRGTSTQVQHSLLDNTPKGEEEDIPGGKECNAGEEEDEGCGGAGTHHVYHLNPPGPGARNE